MWFGTISTHAEIQSQPVQGEDFRFVSIRMRENFKSAFRVLNVLDQAGLMYREEESLMRNSNKPKLQLIQLEGPVAYFEDKNAIS
jgi:hypothetical protein